MHIINKTKYAQCEALPTLLERYQKLYKLHYSPTSNTVEQLLNLSSFDDTDVF